MENGGFNSEAITTSDKKLNDIESQENGYSVIKFNEVDLNRAASLTRDEDQITFSWENITVRTKTTSGGLPFSKSEPKPSRILVDNNSGYVRPGELVAIMGASGAGKSTLLNALTYRYSRSSLDVSGVRYVNGNPVSPRGLTAISAYIMQDDLFVRTLTPREHLEFMARVRMDKNVPKHVRKERVDAVIKELGLAKSQNTVIGIAGRVKGISGGESKRLAFASEVLTNPPLLFCDEPTSGLDSFMAQNVVGVLRSLTRQGKSIICTIHQPSSEVFAMFDRVLLMAEGKLAYLGEIDHCYQFFSEIGHPCPPKYNPSDHYINTLAIVHDQEETCRRRIQDITTQFEDSNERKCIRQVLEYEKANRKQNVALEEGQKKVSPYRASWWAQFWALLSRSWLSALKDPQVMWVNIMQTFAIGILIGIVFLDQSYDQEGIFNVNCAIFMLINCVSFVYQFSVMNVFCLELPVLLREHFNGTYSVEIYYLTKQLADLPFYVVLPIILTSIIYWMVGFNDDIERFLLFNVIIIVLTQVVTGWGYFISSAAGDIQLALAIAPPVIIPLMLFGGFYVNNDTVPGWLSWIQYVSWYYYSNEALLIAQWKDETDIDCQSRYDLACQFSSGEDVIRFYGMDKDNLIFDICMLVVMAIVFRVLALLALLYRAHRKS